MYPEGTFINDTRDNLVIFEKDIDNPDNEGFVCFLEKDDQKIYKLVFKKRLARKKAIEKFNNLLKEGWEKIINEFEVA